MNKKIASLILVVFLSIVVMSVSAQDNVATVEVFVQGVPMIGTTNGMNVNAENHLYVADVFGGRITVLDPDTGAILEIIEGGEIGTILPDDLAFGADGSLYWTDPGLGIVVRQFPDGTRSVILEGYAGINPITMSDDGRLFVAQCFEASGSVLELDPDGVEAPRVIVAEQPGCASNGFDVGPDGALYGPRWFESRIVRIDVETGEITTVADDFFAPAAAKFNSQGELHAVSAGSGQVIRIDMATGEYEVIATLPHALDNMTFDLQDRLFVSNSGDGSVVEVQADGQVRVVSPGGMTLPISVAVVADQVFVGQPQTIIGYDQAGVMQSEARLTWGYFDFQVPFSLFAMDDGMMMTTSWFNNNVQIMNPITGEVLQTIPYLLPMNAIGFAGDIVVADLATASIVRLSGDDYATSETLIGEMIVPLGLAASDDDLYGADAALGMIYQIVADGEMLAEPRVVVSGLVLPEGMAVMPDGESLVVVESVTGNVSMIDIETGAITVLAEGLVVGIPAPAPFPPQWYMNAVAIDDNGVIYVNNEATNTIYRITIN